MPKPRYRWQVQPAFDQAAFESSPELPAITKQLLSNRGLVETETIDRFLSPDYVHHAHDPFLFRDMQKAVDRVFQAIERQERIVVHGDYDADGVCGAAVLISTLNFLGANCDVYLPHRETEGYGVNAQTVEKLAATDTKVMITTDCGISNVHEIRLAKQAGMDVIVTDHHAEPPELPTDAFAIINPSLSKENYPWRKLCGSGVAFKLAQGLLRTAARQGEAKKFEAFEKWLLDIVAISTVTDMVALLDENRVLVKYGLVVLQKTRRPGLRAMFQQMGKSMLNSDTRTLGFAIGPRINAAGRMDHASVAYHLLMTETETEAARLAEQLEANNAQRQQQTGKIIQQALAQVGQPPYRDWVLAAIGDEWPAGIIGLVANKLMEHGRRPAVVLTHLNNEWMGSGRSLPEFNMVEALQKIAAGDAALFKKFGGHPQACGFTLTSLEARDRFIDRLKELGQAALAEKDLTKSLSADAELQLSDVNWELWKELQQFPPYGQANPVPVFVTRGARVIEASKVGDGSHLRLKVEQNGVVRKGIYFRFGPDPAPATDVEIDLAYEIDVNEWNGNRELQLKLIDVGW